VTTTSPSKVTPCVPRVREHILVVRGHILVQYREHILVVRKHILVVREHILVQYREHILVVREHILVVREHILVHTENTF